MIRIFLPRSPRAFYPPHRGTLKNIDNKALIQYLYNPKPLKTSANDGTRITRMKPINTDFSLIEKQETRNPSAPLCLHGKENNLTAKTLRREAQKP